MRRRPLASGVTVLAVAAAAGCAGPAPRGSPVPSPTEPATAPAPARSDAPTRPPGATGTPPPVTRDPAPPPADGAEVYPDSIQIAARLGRELRGISGAAADGTLRPDEAAAARGRAVDHLIGGPTTVVGDGQWLREQLRQLQQLCGDGLLTEPEYQRARSILVKLYLR